MSSQTPPGPEITSHPRSTASKQNHHTHLWHQGALTATVVAVCTTPRASMAMAEHGCFHAMRDVSDRAPADRATHAALLYDALP